MSRHIVIYGNPVLDKPAKKVVAFDTWLSDLAQEMLSLMYANRGIGLAAQQVGETVRICVVDLQNCAETTEKCVYDGKPMPVSIFGAFSLVNPVTKIDSDLQVTAEEGCLSFPGIHVPITRAESIIVRFQDLEGNAHTLSCNGLLARCIQHECDHLDGVTCVKRTTKAAYKAIQTRLAELKKMPN